MNKVQKIQFIPSICVTFIGLITILLYTLFHQEVKVSIYLQIIATGALVYLYPLFQIWFKHSLPLLINILICLHIVLAVDLGSAFNFYSVFSWWDLFLHGYFGVLSCFIGYLLLLECKGSALNTIGFLVFVLMFAMGCSAFWEIFEFLGDTWFGGDAQRIQESIDRGLSPIYDTMWDLIITFIGVNIFYLLFFIDKITGFHICKHIFQGNVQDSIKKTE